jgi:signal transduction histidine kinase
LVEHAEIPGKPSIMGRRRQDFGGVFQHSFSVGQKQGQVVIVEISDTGEGITAENLGRIFEPFFSTKDPGKGTGLGLAICARIIDSFGGRITARSEVGVGTTFTIWLPDSRSNPNGDEQRSSR